LGGREVCWGARLVGWAEGRKRRQIHVRPEKVGTSFCLHFVLFSSRESMKCRKKIYYAKSSPVTSPARGSASARRPRLRPHPPSSRPTSLLRGLCIDRAALSPPAVVLPRFPTHGSRRQPHPAPFSSLRPPCPRRRPAARLPHPSVPPLPPARRPACASCAAMVTAVRSPRLVDAAPTSNLSHAAEDASVHSYHRRPPPLRRRRPVPRIDVAAPSEETGTTGRNTTRSN
jgi:hypothetical protein